MTEYIYKVESGNGAATMRLDYEGSTPDDLKVSARWVSTPNAYISGSNTGEIRGKLVNGDKAAFSDFFQAGVAALVKDKFGQDLAPWIEINELHTVSAETE